MLKYYYNYVLIFELMSKIKQIHHGELLEKAIRESGVTLTVVAKKMSRSRNHLYNLFEYNKIAIETIIEIGKIINHDFSHDIYTLEKEKQKQEDVVKNEILFWKEKYYSLLEEHQTSLKQKIDVFVMAKKGV